MNKFWSLYDNFGPPNEIMCARICSEKCLCRISDSIRRYRNWGEPSDQASGLKALRQKETEHGPKKDLARLPGNP